MVTLVRFHLELLSSQFLLSSFRISDQYDVVQQPAGARRMKQTIYIATKNSDKIGPFLTNGTLDPADYRNSHTSLHTDAVANTISKLGANPILGTLPPAIAASETTLTRRQRSTLSQLRSGQCHLLNYYLVLTGCSNSAICPECLIWRHTVPHIFDCDVVPTTLTIHDLWKNPVSVVGFLKSLSCFSSLEPTEPPPPPEPPP